MLQLLKISVAVAGCLIAHFSARGTAMPQDTAYIRDTFCSNQLFLIGNQIFDPGNPSGTVLLPGASSNGSDSVIIVQLTFRQPVQVMLHQNLCIEDTLWVNGTAYHAGFYLGQEIVANGAANGCDSIIDVQLSFTSSVFDYQAVICEGDTVFINGTAYHTFHKQGEEVMPGGGTAGCDSIIRVNLTTLPLPYFVLKDTLCPDDVLMFNGHRYDRNNRTGLEILEGAATSGCDSLLYLDLAFRDLWVYLGEDREIVKGDTVCIVPQYGLDPQILQWSPGPPCGDPACLTDCIQLLSNAKFSLKVIDVNGCVLTDEVDIFVTDKNRVFAPNIFSPDAPFPNNRFFLSADNGVSLIRRLLIADRWGEIMYDREDLQPDDPDSGWDGVWRGKIAQTGAYTFWADLERLDGSQFTKSGVFSLIR